jgi:phosphopantetheinyl transferase
MERISGLPALQQPDAFFEAWTLKEAYLKALGVGLARHLPDIAFSRSDHLDSHTTEANELWQFWTGTPTLDHRWSVAVCAQSTGYVIKVMGADEIQQSMLDLSAEPRFAERLPL